MKNKKNNIRGYIFIILVLFFVGMIALIGLAAEMIDVKIEKIKSEAQEVIEGIQCEFTYKDLHYKGICTEELIENTAQMIGFDKEMELLQLCMQNPYAYRYELCEDMEATK